MVRGGTRALKSDSSEAVGTSFSAQWAASERRATITEADFQAHRRRVSLIGRDDRDFQTKSTSGLSIVSVDKMCILVGWLGFDQSGSPDAVLRHHFQPEREKVKVRRKADRYLDFQRVAEHSQREDVLLSRQGLLSTTLLADERDAGTAKLSSTTLRAPKSFRLELRKI